MDDPREIFRELIELEYPLETWGDLIKLREDKGLNKGDFVNDPISKQLLKQLEEEGVEIFLDELERHDNGALSLDGKSVIIHISDTQKLAFYLRDKRLKIKGEDKYPKFHFNWCSTVQDMEEKGRFERYVATRKRNGLFRVQAEDKPGFLEDIKLFVCRNCLKAINHEQYNQVSSDERTKIVEKFDIGEFLEKRDRNLNPIKRIPRYFDTNVPESGYTKEFRKKCEILKEQSNWHCSNCGVDMTEKPEGLHCHHEDGATYNNARRNLKILCALCHKNIDGAHKAAVHVSKDIEDYIVDNRPPF